MCLLIAALLCTDVQAWGFGGGAAKDQAREERRRARDRDEGPSMDAGDYEPIPDARKPRPPRENQRKFADRQKMKEEMVKMRSRDRDEMLSKEYNQQVLADDLLDT